MAAPRERGDEMPPLGSSIPMVPPLYQSSVYRLPDLDALDEILGEGQPGYIYARDSHPNARHLAALLAARESASWAAICGSGMAALTATILSVTKQGDRIVASESLYGRTTQLLTQELARYGVQSVLVDCRQQREVRAALEKQSRLFLVETLSNPLLSVADLPALAELAHDHECLFAVDNTFASPVLVRPLEMGADFVVESLTKIIGGHSDVTLGLVCGTGDELARINAIVTIWGLAANPFDCWLAERGLATLDLRLRTASANAAALADWLADQRGVERVVYPGRADHPDHETASRILRGGFGNMLAFQLNGGREAVNRFMRRARGIAFSPSLGHTTTTCSHPATTSHRYMPPEERKRQGIADGLIRLSVGIEELDTIEAELMRGL